MTIQELINKLEKIEDKGLEVLIEKDLYDEDALVSVVVREKNVLLSLYE